VNTAILSFSSRVESRSPSDLSRAVDVDEHAVHVIAPSPPSVTSTPMRGSSSDAVRPDAPSDGREAHIGVNVVRS
jgi:hypothetical protein